MTTKEQYQVNEMTKPLAGKIALVTGKSPFTKQPCRGVRTASKII